MNDLPNRTGLTDLTDAELLLFDVMFNIDVPRYIFCDEVYAQHMNCGYSHGLTRAELDDVFTSLVARKLVTTYVSELPGKPYCFSLTPDGGNLWELERSPNWDVYVSGYYAGDRRFLALTQDELVARLFVGGQFAAGILAAAGTLRTRTIYNYQLLPWKRFARLTVARVRVKSVDSGIGCKWSAYEANRNWWQDVHELDTLSRARNVSFG